MKKLLTSVIAVILLFTLTFPTFAVGLPVSEQDTFESIVLRAEQTKWYYRVYNGKLQKRLWSETYAKWLTDWIDVA